MVIFHKTWKKCYEILLTKKNGLLLKNVGSARLRESDVHRISPKTPAHNTNL